MQRQSRVAQHLRAAADEWYREHGIQNNDRYTNGADHNALLSDLLQILRSLTMPDDESPKCLYLRIPVQPGTGSRMVGFHIAPLITRIRQLYPIEGWWWLNKSDCLGPAVRLRLIAAPKSYAVLRFMLPCELQNIGLRSKELVYEPESFLFGGPIGMDIAHKFFCADSDFLAAWMLNHSPREQEIIPLGLVIAITFKLLRSAQLDLFEMWDVCCRLEAQRPWRGASNFDNKIGERVAQFIWTVTEEIIALYQGSSLDLLNNYFDMLGKLGRELASAHFGGHLQCGLRELLAAILLFHWNRVNLSGSKQAFLAHVLSRELMRIVRANTQPSQH